MPYNEEIEQRINKAVKNWKGFDSGYWMFIDLKISDHQQRWPRPLSGAILIPPALLVVADFW